MSGHSRWAQIKHKKAVSDKKRSQIFSKLIKLITVAAREGTDPETNPKLKAAIERAREFALPNESIERAIKKEKKEKSSLETLLIEAIGKFLVTKLKKEEANIILLIEAITDNKNRTLAEIKNILNKNDFKIAKEGSLLWQFEKRGVIRLINPRKELPERHEHLPRFDQDLSEEDFELQLIESGAEEITAEENKIVIYTKPENFFQLKSFIQEAGIEIESASIDFVPKTPIKIEEEETKKRLNELFDLLDEHNDVEEIYSNVIL